MAVKVATNDRESLIRNLNQNRVVLVLGAGFSREAKNILNENLPDSRTLSAAIWSYLYDEPYDGYTDLKTVFEAALKSSRGVVALQAFLKSKLSVSSFPDWYKLIGRWYWYRIYTFNIDTLIEHVYAQVPSVKLARIVAPSAFEERDQFLRSVQFVKLHGSVELEPLNITFGFRDYAMRASRQDIWYTHFVGDYSTLNTLFIGTELNEQLFWQYLELRGTQQAKSQFLRRPKSFLVSPTISKPHEQVLETLNIVPVRASAQEFLEWLEKHAESPSREQVLRAIAPNLTPAIVAAEHGVPYPDVSIAEYFYSLFRVPPKSSRARRSKTAFLLGHQPTWEDIIDNMDAQRGVTDELKDMLLQEIKTHSSGAVLLHSAAGGGKSTIVKRVAYDFTREGYLVFYSEGELRPDPVRLAEFVSHIDQRCFIIFDHAGRDMKLIAQFCEKVNALKERPVVIIVSRSNDLAWGGVYLRNVPHVREVRIPNLSDPDIEAILKTLEKHDLLGDLKGKNHQQRVNIFKDKAKKQILVAMREATSGEGFDDIIRDEFASVQSSAKLLYLIVCLATVNNFPLSLQQIVVSLDAAPQETLFHLEKSLAGLVLEAEAEKNKYMVRHSLIAEYVISQAPRDLLAEAYLRFLITLGIELPEGRDRRYSRIFRVYRDAISHRRLALTFFDHPDVVRNIYEGIKSLCRDDGHFWLQYGSYELEYGNRMDAAENYLKQALALMPTNPQVETAYAHLLMKKSITAENLEVANNYLDQATRILREQMALNRDIQGYPQHIYGSQMISYIRKWTPLQERSRKFNELYEELRKITPDHLKRVPELKQLLEDIKRLELQAVVTSASYE